MAAPVYPSIPDPTPDPNSILPTLVALKQCVEMLTGQRKGGAAPHARLFVSAIAPAAVNSTIPASSLQAGDLWVDPTNNYTMSFWDMTVGFWRAIP